MKIAWKSVLLNTFLFCLGLVMVYLAFQGQDFTKIQKELSHIRYGYVVLSMCFVFLSHFLRALRWNQLIEPLGYKPKVWNAFQAVMIGYLANLAIPRIGEITRCGILTRATGAPVEELFGTVITERIWDLISLLVLTFLALAFQYSILSNFFYHSILLPLLSKSPSPWVWAILFLILMGAFFLFRFLQKRWMEKNGSNPLVKLVLKFWTGIVQGLKSFTEIKHKLLFLVYTIGIWGGYTIGTFILFFSVPATQFLSISSSLFVVSVGAFGMVAPVQGGIGAYHWMVSHALLLYSISLGSGLVYATVNHLSGVVLIILVGTLSLFSFIIMHPKPKPNQ